MEVYVIFLLFFLFLFYTPSFPFLTVNRLIVIKIITNSSNTSIRIQIFFFLVRSISLKTSTVIFKFTQQAVPKILLLHNFDNLHTDGVL